MNHPAAATTTAPPTPPNAQASTLIVSSLLRTTIVVSGHAWCYFIHVEHGCSRSRVVCFDSSTSCPVAQTLRLVTCQASSSGESLWVKRYGRSEHPDGMNEQSALNEAIAPDSLPEVEEVVIGSNAVGLKTLAGRLPRTTHRTALSSTLRRTANPKTWSWGDAPTNDLCQTRARSCGEARGTPGNPSTTRQPLTLLRHRSTPARSPNALSFPS